MKALVFSSLVFSLLYLLFTVFRKKNYGKYSKQTFRWIWIILILRLLVPSRILLSRISLPTTLSRELSSRTVNSLQNFQVAWGPFLQYFNKVWAVGFLISFSFFIIYYIYFRKSLKGSLIEDSSKIDQLLNTYKLSIPIWITKQNTSPFVTGIFRKTLVLSQTFLQIVDEGDLDYVIQHEMLHIKKRDTLVKILYLFARCLHWFNPLVYTMNKGFSMDLEMACDEALVETLTKDEKLDYCNVLYKYSIANSLANSIYNTSLSPAGVRIKKRFDSILSPKKKYGKGIIMMAGLLVVLLPSFIKLELPQEYYQIEATSLSYGEDGDILIQSEKLMETIVLRKIDESRIVLKITSTIPTEAVFKGTLNQQTINSQISKEDYEMISGLQFTIWQKNE